MKGCPYPTYKPSYADWMGEVPAHWTVDRLKWTVDSARNGVWGDEPDGGPEDIVCIRVADFDRASQTVVAEEPTIRKVRSTDQEGRVLQKGDLLLEKSGGGEGWPAGFVVEYTHDLPAVCSNFIARMKPSAKVRSRYLRFLHHALYAARINVRSIKQTSGIQNLDAGSYFDELAPYPPHPEQDAIGNFLDRETSKIDNLIAEQRTLIERLLEKRQATISHAVTKGLNTAAPMKPSGVEWLGVVPTGWEVVGMTKYLSSLVDYRGRTPNKVDDGVFLLTARNISNGKLDYSISEEYILESEYEDVMRRGKLEIGDVIFTTEAPLGQVANIDRTDIALAQRILKFRGKTGVLDNYFLKYWLMSDFAQADMRRLATGSTALGIKGSKVVQLRLCLPPHQEQREIVSFLDAELTKVDDLITEADSSIALLQEHRSALITAVVTGKVDVRGECHGD